MPNRPRTITTGNSSSHHGSRRIVAPNPRRLASTRDSAIVITTAGLSSGTANRSKPRDLLSSKIRDRKRNLLTSEPGADRLDRLFECQDCLQPQTVVRTRKTCSRGRPLMECRYLILWTVLRTIL